MSVTGLFWENTNRIFFSSNRINISFNYLLRDSTVHTGSNGSCMLGCINTSEVSKPGKANFSTAFKSEIWHSLLDPWCKKDADTMLQVQGRVSVEHSPSKGRWKEIGYFSLESCFWGQGASFKCLYGA